MANFKTGSQRYNDRMDKIWEKARENGAFNEKQTKEDKSYNRHFRNKEKIYSNLF